MTIIRYNLKSIMHEFNRYKITRTANPSIHLHAHDYYEFILVVCGTGIHHLNNNQIPISAGDLFFIRPMDIHRCEPTNKEFEFINVIIETELVESLLSFLGPSFDARLYLNTPAPPFVSLLPHELSSLIKSAERLMLLNKMGQPNLDYLFRIFVLDLFTHYISVLPAPCEVGIPTWLMDLLHEMSKRKNFVEGVPAMYRISGKSPEYIARICKKYMHKTPSELVNCIRLECASNSLSNTDAPIIDICHDVGFNNLSHFYHLFKQAYGLTPNQFRQESNRRWFPACSARETAEPPAKLERVPQPERSSTDDSAL